MNTSSWSWAGARWWRFDFHTHTPASEDYGKGPDHASLRRRLPREWLLDFMRAEIDCVAVTDHNSGLWVDRLKYELVLLDREKPTGYRPLTLFPGVEITVNGGVHLLAILAPTKSTSDVDSLLGAVGFYGTRGSSNAATTMSFAQVVAEIERIGGLAIPAHVDVNNGLFQTQAGTTLGQALACKAVVAMELVDPTFTKPQLYIDGRCNWTEVLGSDAHHPSGIPGQRYAGSHYTWVKMGSPSLEGLRLALLDGALSVRRSDATTPQPNSHGAMVIESIEVENARYLGRPNPLKIELNPWLNTIIGGRGTGKSTLVEFLRIILRRTGEIPDTLATDLERYRTVQRNREDDGLLTENAKLSVVYRKDGTRFKVQWNPRGDVEPILELADDGSGTPGVGEVAERFPIRIYSQKQIYQLAKAPGALLHIIDRAPEVGRRVWDERWKEEETQFLSLRAKVRELAAGLSDESRLQGELDDVKRKLTVFEQSGHATVLKAYQSRKRQQRVVEEWQRSWQNAGDKIREVAKQLMPDSLDATEFDREAADDDGLLKQATQTMEQLGELKGQLEALATRADSLVSDWQSRLAGSGWHSGVDAAMSAYQTLKDHLASVEAGDPAAYGALVQRRTLIEGQLKSLAERREQVTRVQEQADQCLARLLVLRRGLTAARTQFLDGVLSNNEYVRISVVPYGSKDTVEGELRRTLGRDGTNFERDIGAPGGEGLLGRLYEGNHDAGGLEQRLTQLKQQLRATATSQPGGFEVRDQRFAAYLVRLPPEALDRLDLWFPEDSLDVQYSASGNGQRFRSIQDGSPGQKTAALLAFLLSHGDEPLVLDQPEDDLDNHLIYELIVAQLRKVKSSRQLLVVTHNPNIVVNGDAELVIALQPRGGQTQVESQGSLQDLRVRQTICTVMEGGREAFELRYRRIAMGG